MVKICKGIADSQWFTNFILGIIVLAGVVVGMQTYKEFETENHALLRGNELSIISKTPGTPLILLSS